MILADFCLTKINMREGINNHAPFTVRPVIDNVFLSLSSIQKNFSTPK